MSKTKEKYGFSTEGILNLEKMVIESDGNIISLMDYLKKVDGECIKFGFTKVDELD